MTLWNSFSVRRGRKPQNGVLLPSRTPFVIETSDSSGGGREADTLPPAGAVARVRCREVRLSDSWQIETIWYFCHKFPLHIEEGQDTYECWEGNYRLPKLNVANPETRDFLLEVATYGIKEFDIDGWRRDAANEVDPEFWKRFRTAVRSVKPDAYLVGEIWQPAPEWLQGDRFDGVTNYPWRGTVLAYPGVTSIYYGDEIGVEGGKDPDNRRAMPWAEEQWDRGQRDFYKRR